MAYQEQAHLLDPYLERLVDPVVAQFKSAIANVSSSQHTLHPENAGLIAILLYYYVKFRGFKTISGNISHHAEDCVLTQNSARFFPHEIEDLSIALDFLSKNESIVQQPEQWPLRYIMLLWLSLICRLPFDLAQFDEPETVGKTASDLEAVAKTYLDKAGVEREGAAILLARLYAR